MARLLERFAAEPPTSMGPYSIWRLPQNGGLVGLSGDFGIGGPIVGVVVIRDEGTSHHYLPPDAEAVPSVEFNDVIAQALTRRNASFERGATWTIDAPYHETTDEARQYRSAGVLTVEMEAASLFAVAAVRGVTAACAFVLSDLLGETEWTPEFGAARLDDQLQLLAEVGIEAITDLAR